MYLDRLGVVDYGPTFRMLDEDMVLMRHLFHMEYMAHLCAQVPAAP